MYFGVSRLDLEFLPVYRPNAAECADPQLYANNVQKVDILLHRACES